MNILETTLRDGSYVIDFQFTAQDTAIIVQELEELGFEFIEIGHGLGLNASNCGKGTAASSDEEYLKAASSVLKKAKWGTFFIPGIGRIEDIEKAIDYGMHFIRIGTNITEIEQAEGYVNFAKKKGLFVSLNLMKSYALPPKAFAKQAKLAEEFGADIVCLVDSAGGMFPEDIERYCKETMAVTNIKLGFHGHNNLQLAVANTLKAIECGAFLVDCSLQGLGRSAGNVPTEVLILILKKRGLFSHIDANRLMDFSEKFIKPLLQEKGLNTIDLTAGYAQFHSSYLSTIFKYAEKYRVDPREVIVELCKKEVVKAPQELVEDISQQLAYERNKKISLKLLNRKLLDTIKDTIPVSLEEQIKIVIKDIKNISKKFGRKSVFNIVIPTFNNEKKTFISQFIQESFLFVIGSAEVVSLEDLKRIVKTIDGEIDIVLYDAERKLPESEEMFKFITQNLKESMLLLYRDTDVWAKAIENFVLEITKGENILLVGTSNLAFKLSTALADMGKSVFVFGKEKFSIPASFKFISADIIFLETLPDKKMDIIIGIGPYPKVDLKFSSLIHNETCLIDGGIGTFSKDLIVWALERNIKVLRVDMRGVLDAEIKEKLNAYELIHSIGGKTYIKGIECVAGGYYGRKGAVVLDSIKNPKYIVGICDGEGKVKYLLNKAERRFVKKVEKEIFSLTVR